MYNHMIKTINCGNDSISEIHAANGSHLCMERLRMLLPNRAVINNDKVVIKTALFKIKRLDYGNGYNRIWYTVTRNQYYRYHVR